MELTARLERQLKKVREVTEALLAAFQTPEEWTHKVHQGANHPLWVAGHLGTVDGFLTSLLAPERPTAQADYQEMFGMGSRPSSHPGDYPEVAEVLDFMRKRRAAVLEILGGLSDGDLAAAAPPHAPDMMPDVGSIFETAVWHEAMHAGQVTIARRALGHPPLVDAPPKSGAAG
jgi:uncharacterized damage-inducible protein DinB